jgi:hypothetical protein
LRNESGEIIKFFGAQVDVSSLFQKYNDLSAMLSRDFALSEPVGAPDSPRKGFFRRISERTRLRNNMQFLSLGPQSPGLEEEVVSDNITTIGQQVQVFRSAYAKVFFPIFKLTRSISLPFRNLGSYNSVQMLQRHYSQLQTHLYHHNRSSLSSRRHSPISIRDL